MAYDVQYKSYYNVPEWRFWTPRPRTADELAAAVKALAEKGDWLRIVITQSSEKQNEKPKHD